MTQHVDGRVHPHNVDNRARIYEDAQGRLWVTHEELLLCDYRNICDFDVVYLNGRFYELQAHSRKGECWWIEEVPADSEVEARSFSTVTEG